MSFLDFCQNTNFRRLLYVCRKQAAKALPTRIRIFLNPHFFLPDTNSVHTYPATSLANQELFKYALQSGIFFNQL